MRECSIADPDADPEHRQVPNDNLRHRENLVLELKRLVLL
jgi:hypothetical protein